MKNLEWVRSLVDAERRMEETGTIDLSEGPDEKYDLNLKTQEFLKQVKETFIEYVTAFNNMKNASVGGVKIYGISNTVADFMLFRNGYKLIFSASGPGRITISFQTQATQFLPTGGKASSTSSDEGLSGNYGPLGDLTWTYRGTIVNVDTLARYYLTRFVKESIK